MPNFPNENLGCKYIGLLIYNPISFLTLIIYCTETVTSAGISKAQVWYLHSVTMHTHAVVCRMEAAKCFWNLDIIIGISATTEVRLLHDSVLDRLCLLGQCGKPSAGPTPIGICQRVNIMKNYTEALVSLFGAEFSQQCYFPLQCMELYYVQITCAI